MRSATLLGSLSTLLPLTAHAATALTPANVRNGPDHLECYDSGHMARRAEIVKAIDGLCAAYAGAQVTPDLGIHDVHSYPWSWHRIELHMDVTTEPGTGWRVDEGDCRALFRHTVDRCDTWTEDEKQGGEYKVGGVAFALRTALHEGDGFEPDLVWPDMPDAPPGTCTDC